MYAQAMDPRNRGMIMPGSSPDARANPPAKDPESHWKNVLDEVVSGIISIFISTVVVLIGIACLIGEFHQVHLLVPFLLIWMLILLHRIAVALKA